MIKYNRIKEVLQEQERTSAWLARRTGLSQPTCNRFSRQETQPTLKQLFVIAGALGVNPKDLINDIDF